MDTGIQEAAAELERAAKILEEAAIFGANAYANGGPGMAPIVSRHFTKGNEGRYGWAPLTPAYAAWKAVHHPGRPMLVATGELKATVVDIPHKIVAGGDQAIIVFEVPEYGVYHHEGAGYLPKRSPVEPNAEDVTEVANAMKRYLDAQLGTGGAVPIHPTGTPGMARTASPGGGTVAKPPRRTGRQIPAGATPVGIHGHNAVAYYFTTEKGKHGVIAFAGGSDKPVFKATFKNEAQRTKKLQAFVGALNATRDGRG